MLPLECTPGAKNGKRNTLFDSLHPLWFTFEDGLIGTETSFALTEQLVNLPWIVNDCLRTQKREGVARIFTKEPH